MFPTLSLNFTFHKSGVLNLRKSQPQNSTIMEENILKEIKQIRQLLAKLVGTSELPAGQKFSKEAIAKAAKEFKQLSVARGEWLVDYHINKVVKNAPHFRPERLLIEKFGFTNYFKQGHKYYFNRKDLVALNKELKERNINLEKYAALLEDKAKFEKSLKSINLPKGTKTKKHYTIPEGLMDINHKPYPAPSEELVMKELDQLMEEYKKFDLSEYIELYESRSHAFFKFEYLFDRYLKPELKKQCKAWCFKFNYANDALKKIKEEKTKSVYV